VSAKAGVAGRAEARVAARMHRRRPTVASFSI
jgi:hypothetical protein